jgi:mannitol/fructose-specific phosphotransferase system IIA component (Ntr-type)
MPQSGQEMLDETIAACKSIAEGLVDQNQEWENSIVEIVDKFEEVSETFFFKTMPSVPVTRTAMRDAASVLKLKNASDWDAMGGAVETLITSAQNLIEKAGMKGTTLT